MIDDRIESVCVQRLNRIEGQIRGIANMIKQRRYCVDIITQIIAAESALHKVSEIIMRNHLETCVLATFKSGSKADKEAKVDELMQIYAKFKIT
jgi:DNA-binding FrmR family transcriptional regulator